MEQALRSWPRRYLYRQHSLNVSLNLFVSESIYLRDYIPQGGSAGWRQCLRISLQVLFPKFKLPGRSLMGYPDRTFQICVAFISGSEQKFSQSTDTMY